MKLMVLTDGFVTWTQSSYGNFSLALISVLLQHKWLSTRSCDQEELSSNVKSSISCPVLSYIPQYMKHDSDFVFFVSIPSGIRLLFSLLYQYVPYNRSLVIYLSNGSSGWKKSNIKVHTSWCSAPWWVYCFIRTHLILIPCAVGVV